MNCVPLSKVTSCGVVSIVKQRAQITSLVEVEDNFCTQEICYSNQQPKGITIVQPKFLSVDIIKGTYVTHIYL